MATLAILAPMRAELAPIVRRLGLHRDRSVPGPFPTWTGRCGRTIAFATMAGVGTRRAAEVAEAMVHATGPDHVIIAGVAGGLAPMLSVGDLVVPATVRDLDADTEVHAHPFGNLVLDGTLLTSTEMHGWNALEGHARAGALAIDMETAAIAVTCERHGTPWTAIRALSDVVRSGTVDASTLTLVAEDGSTDLLGVVRHLTRDPRRIRSLARMGRDASRATHVVAAALHDELGNHGGRS